MVFPDFQETLKQAQKLAQQQLEELGKSVESASRQASDFVKESVEPHLDKLNNVKEEASQHIESVFNKGTKPSETRETELFKKLPQNETRMLDITAKLENTQKNLKELGQGIENLVLKYPDAFADETIQSQLEKFRQAHQEALQRLDPPNLSIATIGTTSSGKSTVVNALIGCRIAPIEAGEMSAGVLTLRHSNERKLIIEATEGATWEAGEWEGLSDEDLYNKIRSVMTDYHQIRQKQKICIAPQVKVIGSLFPALEQSLLGLPDEIGIELIDLPGLKSVQDADNLAVIQSQVNKAFCLVALDYMQVDDQHRKRLLEELKQVVKYLQGRTDSMIFILNRVDQRGSDDVPLEERIGKLQSEIQETLSLEVLPDILPFNARLLYSAQCAWGPGSLKSKSLVDQQTRLKLLKAMFQDCAGTIKQYVGKDKNLRGWFRDLEDQVEDGENIDDETLRKVLRYAYQWSGGEQLWHRLRVRLQESFSELVILPALFQVFASCDALTAKIDVLAETRKIKSQEEIQDQQAKIEASRQRLSKKVKSVCRKFHKKVEDKVEFLKKDDTVLRSQVGQKAQAQGLQGFQILIDAIDEIEADLTEKLICPVRNALKNNLGTYELEEKLNEVIAPTYARNITKAYDLVSRKCQGFTHQSGYWVNEVCQDDSKGIQELRDAERAVRSLYFAMREALSVRAEFMLQAQAKQLENVLQSLAEQILNEEVFDVCRQEFPDLKLDEAIIAEFKNRISQTPPTLPENLFNFSANIKQSQNKNKEVVGKQAVQEDYTTGSCFNKKTKTRTVWKDKIEQVEYQKLELPDADNMARQWSAGIAQEEKKLWDILRDWMINHLKTVDFEFEQSIDDTINFVNRSLQEQLEIIQRDFEAEVKRWDEITLGKDSVLEIRQNLENESRTS
ncbi:dynamin family protein [Limnoraphis robusta]|uniref:Dynamin family protein n=1 Tax=Limnoraphis robusta CCNP1315 TaxID=3110306 RepID=A0ABU5TSQ0_9CYAN|nr:dynamin family protein [Limnoraphis robusta]MEA5517921.1 dynamin family protein [Limnoraphis robusta CCNP1315]MEA5543738.1 dynamin family protein [Limnoraphis robusta CCNP1324]